MQGERGEKAERKAARAPASGRAEHCLRDIRAGEESRLHLI
jgi:hypothetical protein